MIAQHEQLGRYREDEGFEVVEVVIAGTPYIRGREEGEDIFCRLWQLPELCIMCFSVCRLYEARIECTYTCPVLIIGSDSLVLRKLEDALFED